MFPQAFQKERAGGMRGGKLHLRRREEEAERKVR